MASTTPLLRAHSHCERFTYDGIVLQDVTLEWFRLGQRESGELYDRFFAEGTHNDVQRLYGTRVLDECFTTDEADQLENYLAHRSSGDLGLEQPTLITTSVAAPIQAMPVSYKDLPTGGMSGYYRLDEEAGYDLPFAVHGYLRVGVQAARTTPDMTDSAEYLHRALQSLGVASGISRDEIIAVAEKLFRRSGLYVAQQTDVAGIHRTIPFDDINVIRDS